MSDKNESHCIQLTRDGKTVYVEINKDIAIDGNAQLGLRSYLEALTAEKVHP